MMKEPLKVTQNDLFLYLDSKIPRRAIQMNLADTPWRLKGKLCDVEPMDDQWDLFFRDPDLKPLSTRKVDAFAEKATRAGLDPQIMDGEAWLRDKPEKVLDFVLEHQAWLGLPKQPSVPQETLDAYARRFEDIRHLGYIHRR